MTSVYSGGLVYEYSEEDNKYGLTKIGADGKLTDKPDFAVLQKKFKATPNPAGDGGYNSTGGASGCPKKSLTWDVDGDSLPAIPEAAKAVSLFISLYATCRLTFLALQNWCRCWCWFVEGWARRWIPRWSRCWCHWWPIQGHCIIWIRKC